MEEQVKIRMGLDSADVEQGARRVNQTLQEMGDKGHHSFVHAGSAGKGFHKILHEITEQSPLMGNALRLAISPVAGAFMLAAAALGYFHEHFKKLNEEFDKMGDLAAKPVGDVKERLREGARAAEELERQFQKWRKEKTPPGQTITEHLHQGMENLDEDSQKAIKKGANKDEVERKRLQLTFQMQKEASEKIRKQNDDAEKEHFKLKEQLRLKDKQNASGFAKDQIDDIKGIQDRARERLKEKEKEFTQSGGILWEGLKHAIGWGPDGKKVAEERLKEMEEIRTTISTSEKQMDNLHSLIEKEATARKTLADRMEEEKKKADSLTEARKKLLVEMGKTTDSLNAMGPPKIDPDLHVRRMQEFDENTQRRMEQFDRMRGIVEEQKDESTLGFSKDKITLANIDKTLKDMLKKYNDGVAVFGVDTGTPTQGGAP